jgi:hypothetical protein
VRVYDAVGLPGDVRRSALVTAADIFAAASIDVRWIECHTRLADHGRSAPAVERDAICDATPGRGELLVRIVRSDSPFTEMGGVPLGEAVIEPNVRPGGIATVHYSRISWLARAAGTHVGRLLGRVMAHELGHLLLARVGHSAAGLMRPGWSHNDVRRSRVHEWRFTADETAVILSRLQEQAAGSSEVSRKALR